MNAEALSSTDELRETSSRPLSLGKSWALSAIKNAWVPILLFGVVWLGRDLEFADQPGQYVMHVAMIAAINIILAVSLQLINGVSGQFSLGHAGFMAVGAYLAGYATLTFAPRGYDPNADYSDPRLQFANPGGVLLFFVALGVAAALVAIAGGIVYWLVGQTRRASAQLPLVLALGLLVWVAFDARGAIYSAQVPGWCIWSRSALEVVNIYGWILEKGAPAALWMSGHLPAGWLKPLCLLIALIGGGCAAMAAGFVVGIPTLRLRGDYLAIATLGFGEIIRNIIVTIPDLGAATGLSVNVYWTQPTTGEHPDEAFYMGPWIFGTAALTLIIINRLVRSPKGTAIQTVRDDEIAAAAIGVDPTQHRVLAFVTGAFFAGVAGALYAHLDGYLNANSFSFLRSIEIVVMCTLGGMTSLWGAAIAAVVLTAIPEVLDNAQNILTVLTEKLSKNAHPELVNNAHHSLLVKLSEQAHWLSENRQVMYAGLLLVIVIAKAKIRSSRAR